MLSWLDRKEANNQSESLSSFFYYMAFSALLAFTALSCGSSRVEVSLLEIKADSIFISLEAQPEIQQGYQAYTQYGCILCHGSNGEGGIKNKNAQTGEEIPSLIYIAEGYTVPEFRSRVLKGLHNVAKLDSLGDVPPMAMPGWGNMDHTELDNLVKYVWSLYPQDEEDDDW